MKEHFTGYEEATEYFLTTNLCPVCEAKLKIKYFKESTPGSYGHGWYLKCKDVIKDGEHECERTYSRTK